MPEKFTIEQKERIVDESFTATNIAELCRKQGVSVAQFHPKLRLVFYPQIACNMLSG